MNPLPQALVLFGASGDLTARKLMPALYGLARDGLLPEASAIVGYARSAMTDEEFRARMRDAVEKHSRHPLEEDVWKPLAERLSYVAGPFDESGCMAELDDHLDGIDRRWGTERRRLYYCATPPSAFPLIVRRIGESCRHHDPRIVIEKPFGRDLASARALNRIVHEVFDESRVFRIDHYLGKETVQNLLVFRFANAMFERVWNRDAIDHVEVTVAESIGVGGRGGYYEEAGALRDIVQNHMLQVLSFLAMEPPRSMEPAAIQDEKVKVLRALQPFAGEDAVRGQYASGEVDGEPVPGYRTEAGVGAGSQTETFFAVRARIDNWRWSGVPFYLRTGKRLPRRTTEIAVVFREAPGYLFEQLEGAPPPDHLVVRIQPSEGISFAFQAKEPGPGFMPTTVRMDFSYDEFFDGEAAGDAYGRLLLDAMAGDQTLFPREDGVERSWEVVEPLLADPGPVHAYAAGSWGPEAADDLIAPRKWHTR